MQKVMHEGQRDVIMITSKMSYKNLQEVQVVKKVVTNWRVIEQLNVIMKLKRCVVQALTAPSS